MFHHLHHWLIGNPLPTKMLHGERLDRVRALAALSPDALSSIAYANQEIYLGLVVAGSAGLALSLPIAGAIGVLLLILTLSYSQTIQAYPRGGGSYTVASENLGKWPGLIAAAALLIDYVLTAAVSLTAGVAALASAFPDLWPYRVEVALVLLFVITVTNLRGLREAGTLISIPVYSFVGAYLVMIGVGIIKALVDGLGSVDEANIASHATESITLFLVLHTFSSGCTALTGVEAISNGVGIFKPPETRHARQVMVVMAAVMGLLLFGTIALTQFFGVTAHENETILSALTREIFGRTVPYYVVSLSTLAILVVAANTSFVGFPGVSSLIAQDGYMPRQLTSLGDRLVFSNGIFSLTACVAALIIIFGGDSHALIPLFAVGVFLAFTLSQTGMVVHWMRVRGPHWHLKAAINGLGAITTAVTLVVVAASKFLDGAWIIMLLIPMVVYFFHKVHEHYQEIRPQLSLEGVPYPPPPVLPLRVVVPVSGMHRGTLRAIQFAQSISSEVTAVYIELDETRTEKFKADFEKWSGHINLVIIPSPYRSILGPLLHFLEAFDREQGDRQPAVLVLPEFIPGSWWQHLLHNQTAWLIKLAVIYQRRRHGGGRIVVDVPFHLRG
ncbi:MAG: APC family permease [Anaerolineae bacterium]|nr:APC family permease [Anaerolineae bacterium]